MDPMQNLEDSDRRMGEPATMSSYNPERSRWPGIIGAIVVVAVVAGVALWNHHEKQSAAPPTPSGAVAPPAEPAQPPRADAQQQRDAMTETASAAPLKQ